mmetsp:Transcript_6111/g.8944  ORF Transcript_6111/g.8944 Transcript_6111/m.8944 type:complete len:93 (+) Transcript_6111:433-711(+)
MSFNRMLTTRLFVLFACFSFSNGQAAAPDGGCLICGNGKVVAAPKAVFTFPGQPAVPCGQLQDVGLVGTIPLEECAILPDIPEINACKCVQG